MVRKTASFILALIMVTGIAAQAGLRPSAERIELLQNRFDRIRSAAENQNRLAGGFLSSAGFFSLGAGLFMVVADKPNPTAANYLMGAGLLSMLTGTLTLAGASEFERYAYEHAQDRQSAIGGEKDRVRIAEDRLQDLRRTARFQRVFTNSLLVGLGAWNIGLYEKQRWGLSGKQELATSGLAASGLGLWRTLAERRFSSGGALATAGLVQLIAYAWDNDPALGYLLGTGVFWTGWGLSHLISPHSAENEYQDYQLERGESFVSWRCYPVKGGAGLQAQLSF